MGWGLCGAYRGGILGSQVINPGMSRSAMSGPKWAVLEGAGGEAIIAIVSTSPAQMMCTTIRMCTIIRSQCCAQSLQMPLQVQLSPLCLKIFHCFLETGTIITINKITTYLLDIRPLLALAEDPAEGQIVCRVCQHPGVDQYSKMITKVVIMINQDHPTKP